MSRLEFAPDLQFAESFRQLRRDIEDIKRAQKVGRDILKPKLIECLNPDGTPTDYDLIATAVPDGYGGYIVREDFVARFQADHQDQTWGVPLYKLMYGNPSTPATPGQAYGFLYPYFDDFTAVPGKVSHWGYFGNNDFLDDTSIYIKVYFYATDTGTLTVTAEAIP